MTVDTAYKIIQFLARKNQTGSITPNEFEFAFNSAQRGYFDFLIGQVEQYRYGKSLPRVGLGESSRIANALSPFKYGPTSITVTSGVAPYPAGFHTLALLTDANGLDLERIDDTRISERSNSVIDPLTTTNPFYVESKTGWSVYPTLATVKATYYKTPTDVIWGNTSGTYNPGTSTHPEWKDSEMDEVLGRAAGVLGFSFEKQNLVQFGSEVKATGA